MVTIRGKKHTFNMNVIGKLDYDEFKKHCSELTIFNQLPIKDRNNKIKECYGRYFGNVKKVSKFKSGFDLHNSNVESVGGDSRAKPKTNVGGENFGGQKYKTKVQNEKLREENSE